MPPVGEPIAPETIIDISHESLMRVWDRLKAWVDEEAESAAQYQRLVQNMSLHAKGAAGLMTDPELSLMLEWQQKWQPNAAWAERYRPGFDSKLSRFWRKVAQRATLRSAARTGAPEARTSSHPSDRRSTGHCVRTRSRVRNLCPV